MGSKNLAILYIKKGDEILNQQTVLKNGGSGTDGSKLNFEYFVKDIKNDLEKYKILYIDRQGKLLRLCNNLIKEINKKKNSINNRFNIENNSNKYNISRYLTLINREFYQNIFKKYFINIIQLFNETNFTNVQENLKGIARELQFINKEEKNEDKEMLINNDFKMFEKYSVDDIVIPDELYKSIKKSFSEMKSILNNKINDNKDQKSFDITSIQNILNTDILNYINNLEFPEWQSVLLNTFEYEIADIKSNYEDTSSTINNYINTNFYLDYVNEISEYLSNEYYSVNHVKKGNNKLSKELKLKVEKLIKDINTSIESVRNKDKNDKINYKIHDILTRVILIIKKHLLKLVRKNYLNSLENIDILINYVQKEISELQKSISDYANKLNSNKPEEEKKEQAQVSDPETHSIDRQFGGGNKKSSSIKQNYKVCSYITDVEGNMSYFEKYVKISKVIGWTNDKKDRLQFKTKNSIFVYGGDTQDKGDNDIMFVNLLLKFKEDYPDRVFFIIGNRDANKLRFPSELLENYSNEKAFIKKYDNFPYWVKKDIRVTLKNYLKMTNSTLNIKNRLKYILKHTMGCKNDCFERRRKELSIILKKNISNIRDEDVVASFLNSVMPIPENVKNSNDNYMLKYLRHGKIAHIFGKHIFVHGSINENNIGYVPKSKKNIEDINEWVNKLNEWFHKELSEYIKNPKSGGISKKRKAYSIIDYSVPQAPQAKQEPHATSKKISKPSVVYSDNLKDGNGAMINSKVIKQLNKSGIYTVITGHKPHGDCPLVIRNKNLIAISADISYSNVNHLREKKVISDDTRGSAVCEVLLYFNGNIRVHGILANKSKYNYLIKLEDRKDRKDRKDPKQYIGLQLKNRYWVKNVIKDKFLISLGKGFDIFEKWVSIKELKELLK